MEAISLTQRNLIQAARFVLKMAAAIVMLGFAVRPAAGQPSAASGQFLPYKAPRMADGRPDLNGTWQAFVTADWDLQDHEAATPAPPAEGERTARGGRGGEVVGGGETFIKKRAAGEEETELSKANDGGRQ